MRILITLVILGIIAVFGYLTSQNVLFLAGLVISAIVGKAFLKGLWHDKLGHKGDCCE